MELSHAIKKARSIADLNDIFEGSVVLELGLINDVVTIDRYRGAVNTDCIARKVMAVCASGALVTEESKKLAKHLATKVFDPLTTLVELPKNQCSLYQLTALTRIFWTPPQAHRFGHAVALKHAMVLGLLDDEFDTW